MFHVIENHCVKIIKSKDDSENNALFFPKDIFPPRPSDSYDGGEMGPEFGQNCQLWQSLHTESISSENEGHTHRPAHLGAREDSTLSP